MGNACCYTGSRHNNRVLPTYSSALVQRSMRNKDLASYRRHKKKDDVELGLPVGPGISKGTIEVSEGENSKQESFENIEKSKPDKEMQDWIGSIILQNHLVPSYMTFDNERHLSMRSKYADMTQIMNIYNSIKETKEEHQFTHSRAPSARNKKGLKKKGKQGINKNLSHETFNLGLGPKPTLSTRISKDVVKRNKQKDNQLKFHGSKSPPPPKLKPAGNRSNGTKACFLKNSVSKGVAGKNVEDGKNTQTAANSSKHFHVSSNWLDEDFEENILSFPKEIPKSAENIPQCSKLPPIPAKKSHGQKSIKFKIEQEISELAVHDLGLFLSAVEEDQYDPKPNGRVWDVLKKKNRTSSTYTADDSDS